MMVQFKAYLTGILPRDDYSIDIFKKFEWKLIDEKTYRETVNKLVLRWVDLQVNLHMDYIHDPQVDWPDIFRFYSEIDGIVAGPLTRYFENNYFYRKLIITEKVNYINGILAEYSHHELLPSEHPWKITIPGPYTMYRLSESYLDKEETIEIIGKLVAGSVLEAFKLGYSLVDLHEPSLVYDDEVDEELVLKLYMHVKKLGLPYHIHTFFGSAYRKLSILLKLNTPFSIDIFEGIDDVRLPVEEIIVGLINSQNTLLEKFHHIKNYMKFIINNSLAETIYLSTNCDLDFLPFNVAINKVMLLNEFKRRLEREWIK